MNATATLIAPLRLALPKGRMQQGLLRLLAEAGIDVRSGARSYRPTLSLPEVEAKLLKPQNAIRMLAAGSRDVGFAGADWVEELDAPLVEILDTGLDPVRLVAAAPTALLVDGRLPDRPLVIATEYVGLTRKWIERRGIEARIVRSYGATEVFPPEDSDLIVDNTATGATLAANDLRIVDELMRSSTRLYASPDALRDPARRARVEDLALLLQGVLEARQRVLVELNVPQSSLERVLSVVPCMREPTVSGLAGDGYAVRVAVLREVLPTLIPEIRAAGGTDILVSQPSLIVPGGAV